MGFLRRFRGEPPAVPDWATFFTPDEYRAFLTTVRTVLDQGGDAYTIGDGVVRISGSPQEFGLTNLAQVCHITDQADWPEVVSTHFAKLRSTSGRDVDAMAADFDQVQSILRVRLLADESMGGIPLGAIGGSRAWVPGIMMSLVYDFPDSTQSVPIEHVERWPLAPDDVWAIAIENLRLAPQPVRQEVPAKGASFTVALGDDFYVASRALRLADEMPPGTSDAIFAAPNRHVLIWHAIRDLSVVAAIQGMTTLASRQFVEGPGSISNQLYWWHAGTVVHLPVSIDDKSIAFTPPNEFVEFLNALPPA